ncbi:MAG: hypothetical protein [Bacteriophage sp.]|nr:MAG: hypothetical protein [Bacteriophage sp.]
MNQTVKKDYSDEIEEFVKNGGEIKPAVNSKNPSTFDIGSLFRSSREAKNQLSGDENKNSKSTENAVIRKRASNAGKKSYVPVSPCASCGTSERSVRSNACLECDRRRFRLKTGASEKNMVAVASHLIANNKTFTCTISGKKYILKAEMIDE